MAALSDEHRAEIAQALQSALSSQRTEIAVTKQEFRGAVNALDAWLEANAAAANNALPAAAKAGLTIAQKALLMMEITRRRYLDG